jgi:hypothetical protein
MSSVVKYCPMLSNDTLESELSVGHRSYTFADVKSVYDLWNLVKENNLETTLSEMYKLVRTVPTTPVSIVGSDQCFCVLKRGKT